MSLTVPQRQDAPDDAFPGATPARGSSEPALTRLHRLDGDDPATVARRTAVVALLPLPEQEPFSSRAELTLPAADADPHRTPFAVEHDGVPVGFGVLDTGALLDEIVDQPERAVLLRAFYIDAGAQGRGHGRTAARLLRALARSVAPGADIVVLTVNERNPAAIRAYAAGGFVDVGRYLGGSLGPQRIMAAAIEPAPPADSTT